MSENKEVTLADLTPAQVVALMKQYEAAKAAETVARKASREKSSKMLTTFVTAVAKSLPVRTFNSGAEGWGLGGTVEIVVGKDADGNEITRRAKTSMLIRWADTIPAKDDAHADAAESDETLAA